MDSKSKQRLPEIGEYIRGQGTLVAIQEIIPPPPPVDRHYIFEEITARIELRLGTEVLNGIGRLWDFYGKESSIDGAIEDAQKYASERKIGPASELEVVVIKIVEQVRKHLKEHEENFYDRTFVSFEPLKFGCKVNLPDPVETVVWSSRKE